MVRLKRDYKDTKIGDITVGSVIGGMRGMTAMLYETSKLHPVDGITYRGKDLDEIIRKVPKAPNGGTQPLPEGVLWQLLTGEIPNDK